VRAVGRVVVAVVLLLGLWSSAAEAACTVSTTSVSFGTYDVFTATADDSTGTVSVRCDAATSVTIQIGRGSSPTFAPRTMTQGASALGYNLFRNNARTIIWGDGTSGTSTLVVSVNANQTRTQTIFGRVPARQDVPAGGYADTVVVTIVF
jgi:spore coat protein U-like protein